ncbi:hypothetical protein SAMN02745116_00208 [Pilibacter termitis]|uniref:DUF3188 domain-containing protein n=1 Tax=Pilibacter termitis TaxID=263852 RepID=A0A1T4KE76_9ENTE|nr:hypothetical protein [Pilibacter termitis]SJZ40655.1 hypothetical protein SAMN02745116_00208 [Pilibacter termitis]
MKNGLALISVGCLIFLVLGVNHSTMEVNNFGVLLTSAVIVGIGIFLAIRDYKNRKE